MLREFAAGTGLPRMGYALAPKNDSVAGMNASRLITLLFLLLPAFCLAAADQPPLPEAEKQAIRARADGLLNQASNKRATAEIQLVKDKSECQKRFLVTACVDQAEERRRVAFDEAKKFELEGNRLHRELRARNRAENSGPKPSTAPAAANPREHEQKLRGFEDRSVERAARKQEGKTQEAGQKRQLEQHEAAKNSQTQRNAEAGSRQSEAHKQLDAYQAAQQQAKERAKEAEAQAARP